MLERKGDALIYAVIAANLLGTAFGFAYYWGQLLETPVWLWLFVPDCPNYTLLFAVSLFLLLRNRRYDLYNFLVSVGAMKYGFWTMFVTLLYSDYFLSPAVRAFYSVLFLLHLGMMLEVVLILHKIEVRRVFIPITFSWFFLNDLLDYSPAFAVHPWLPYSVALSSTLPKATFGMSLFFTLLVYLMCKRARRPLLLEFWARIGL